MPFQDLADRVSEIRERIAAAVARGGHQQQVQIVAVTKTHGPEAVVAAWQAGIENVGENRVQEALSKMEATSSVPVQWHLIGHLQRNKAKATERFALVHSVDSLRLAQAIDAVGVDRGSPVPALIQINVVEEESKGGFSIAEAEAATGALAALRGIDVRGVMAMAPLGATEATLRLIFGTARASRDGFCRAGFAAKELSMGMSSDYEIAVEEGATMVRLGSTLFGARSA